MEGCDLPVYQNCHLVVVEVEEGEDATGMRLLTSLDFVGELPPEEEAKSDELWFEVEVELVEPLL